LLADSLSGQAKVMMFLHVSPESSSFGESLSTLKFGWRVSEITLGQAKRNVEQGSTLYAKEAQV
jgi:kinesin family member C2/C3